MLAFSTSGVPVTARLCVKLRRRLGLLALLASDPHASIAFLRELVRRISLELRERQFLPATNTESAIRLTVVIL